jgi:hypothetical protein
MKTDAKRADSDDRRFTSLQHALDVHRIPAENHHLITEFTQALGIEGYYGRTGYIKAVRQDGKPALQIHSGYTNGFQSAEEANHPGIGGSPWKSGRGTKLWGISHPSNRLRSGNKRSNQKRHFGHCPSHGYELNARGECDAC